MKSWKKLILTLTVICILPALAACSTKNSDQDFGDAYDAEYMMTDYPDQLIRDGADTVIGTIEITGEEGSGYSVTVDQKKVVANANYEDGYYIADRNITDSYPMGSDQGILAQRDGEIVVCTVEDFIKDYSDDKDALYTVYLIGDTVELIQPLDPQTAIQSQE